MRRFLAVRQDNNGDVLLCGPALRALARSAAVTLMCGPSGEAAARLLPDVADVIVARADWIEGEARPVDPGEIAGQIARVRALAPDEAFVFTSFHQSPLPTALVLRLAGVPRVHAISVDYPGALLDTRAHVDDGQHEVLRALQLVAAAGYVPAPDDDARLRVRALPDVDQHVRGRFVAVQPGASVPARRWDPGKMRALVDALSRLTPVVVLGSAAEVALAEEVVGTSGAINLAGATTFAEFAAIIARADALVVGNTSGIHVASATGTPVVALFPPTIPALRFAPWGVPHVLLGDQEIACAGCRARCCPLPGQPCLGAISTADVLDALTSLGILPARRLSEVLH